MAKHPIPDAALDQDLSVIAQKGAGKSYMLRGLVERLARQKRRVVVLDPMEAWWGIKARQDGRPGYPFVVVGGPRADVALDPSRGAELGEFIARASVSVVIDVSELKRGELLRFANDFLAALYRANREALWLVLEEADVFAPQNPMGDATMLLHQVDQIARRGRARGFKLWTVTQRPAKLHKDVLTQTSTLVMMRTRSPQDRAAAEEWIKGNADPARARDIVGELASLPVGEGWVWAPDLDLLERVKFPPIETLDTTATPIAGQSPAVAGQLAKADVAQLQQLMAGPVAGSVKQSKATEPNVDQLFAADQQGYARGDIAGYARGVTEGRALGFSEAVASMLTTLQGMSLEAKPPTSPQKPSKTPPKAAPTPPPSPPASVAGEGDELPEAAHEILNAARMAPRQVNWTEAGFLAGYMPQGGYFETVKRRLKNNGWPEPPPNDLADEGPLHSSIDLCERLGKRLEGKAAARRFFNHMYAVGPRSRQEIAAELGMAAQGGFFETSWRAVRRSPLFREVDTGRYDILQILRELKDAGL